MFEEVRNAQLLAGEAPSSSDLDFDSLNLKNEENRTVSSAAQAAICAGIAAAICSRGMLPTDAPERSRLRLTAPICPNCAQNLQKDSRATATRMSLYLGPDLLNKLLNVTFMLCCSAFTLDRVSPRRLQEESERVSRSDRPPARADQTDAPRGALWTRGHPSQG